MTDRIVFLVVCILVGGYLLYDLGYEDGEAQGQKGARQSRNTCTCTQ